MRQQRPQSPEVPQVQKTRALREILRGKGTDTFSNLKKPVNSSSRDQVRNRYRSRLIF